MTKKRRRFRRRRKKRRRRKWRRKRRKNEYVGSDVKNDVERGEKTTTFKVMKEPTTSKATKERWHQKRRKRDLRCPSSLSTSSFSEERPCFSYSQVTSWSVYSMSARLALRACGFTRMFQLVEWPAGSCESVTARLKPPKKVTWICCCKTDIWRICCCQQHLPARQICCWLPWIYCLGNKVLKMSPKIPASRDIHQSCRQQQYRIQGTDPENLQRRGY